MLLSISDLSGPLPRLLSRASPPAIAAGAPAPNPNVVITALEFDLLIASRRSTALIPTAVASGQRHMARSGRSAGGDQEVLPLHPPVAQVVLGRETREFPVQPRDPVGFCGNGCPVDQPDRAARLGDAYQFVRGRSVERREHDAHARNHGVELGIGVGQCLGVGVLPLQIDAPGGGDTSAPSNISGVRSLATTCAPVSAAGIAAFPDPAAMSSTRRPGPIPQTSTRCRPSPGTTSVATAG